MKNFIIFSIFSVFLIIVLSISSSAADLSKNGFTVKTPNPCLEPGFNSITDPNFTIARDEAVLEDLYPDLCYRETLVDGINEYRASGNGQIIYCGGHFTRGAFEDPYPPSGERIMGKDALFGGYSTGSCCVETGGVRYEYWYNVGGFAEKNVCCKSGRVPKDEIHGNVLPPMCGSVEGMYWVGEVKASIDDIENLGLHPGADDAFYFGEMQYECQTDHCVLQSPYEPGDVVNPHPTIYTNVDNLKCLRPCESVPNFPDVNCSPNGGAIVPKADCKWYTLDKTCENLGSIDEEDACHECMDRNKISGQPEQFVYTSIGCVDVSRNGIVTRVFQIGVGLIGGIAIYKVIRAAFLYQQNDPSKHKEAQEEMTNAFWAILLVVGAIVILRFIGINVLGILPFSFLQ